MFDDGQHGDGQAADGVWGAILAPAPEATIVDYYASAATNAGVMRFEPATAENKPPLYQVGWPKASSPVQLNEFLASNQNGIQDEASEFEDWLELLNTGTAPVDMSGCYLTDKIDNPTKWPIPANTILQPGATLLIWCDEDANQGPLHANFKLSAGGEQILLFAADGKTQLDRIDFGTQTTDVSTGRMVALPSLWVTFPTPTPRTPNRADPSGHLPYGPAGFDYHRHEPGGNGHARAGNECVLFGKPRSDLYDGAGGAVRDPGPHHHSRITACSS